jgi:hypothetical protein
MVKALAMANDQLFRVRLRPAHGSAVSWAGDFGYKWTVDLHAPKEFVGAGLAIRFQVQLSVGHTTLDLGPVSTAMCKFAADQNEAFARMEIAVTVSEFQIQTIETARSGGAITVRIVPCQEWSSNEVFGALDQVEFGRGDIDGSWWRQALSTWGWGSSLVQIIRSPVAEPGSPLTHAYKCLLDSQAKLVRGEYRSSIVATREVFEVLKNIERPGEEKGPNRSVPERWWDLNRVAAEAFAVGSGAGHSNPEVVSHPWTRNEAESLIAIATGCLRIFVSQTQ